MRITLFILLALLSSNLNSQTGSQSGSISKGKIYALIIGISNYKDENISDLKYSHKDAELFATYLLSKAGGNVPKENITILTNEKATIANIYNAKQSIEEKIKENDLLYFYFSGHGDVEKGLYKKGFLLAHDTPYKNYLLNAIKIEDINDMSNYLSVELNVNVVLITDACHSGKLAGSDNRGTAAAAEQLMKMEKNEIRLASCEAEQKSQEGEVWGGGRSVFSYYLLNGLRGLADDEDADGVISFMELKYYLEKNVPKDVAKIKTELQTPVIRGNNQKLMAVIDDEELIKLKENPEKVNINLANLASKSIDDILDIDFKYFNKLSTYNLSKTIDFKTVKTKTADEIIDVFLNEPTFNNKSFSDSDWYKSLFTNLEVRKEYKSKLAVALHNYSQNVINNFVTKDTSELKNIKFELGKYSILDECADILETANKVIDYTHPLYKIIKIKKHYTRGLSARLKLSDPSKQDSLIRIAIQEQDNAFANEKEANFINDERKYLSKYYRYEKKTTRKRKIKTLE